jgi:hypothetical protein
MICQIGLVENYGVPYIYCQRVIQSRGAKCPYLDQPVCGTGYYKSAGIQPPMGSGKSLVDRNNLYFQKGPELCALINTRPTITTFSTVHLNVETGSAMHAV